MSCVSHSDDLRLAQGAGAGDRRAQRDLARRMAARTLRLARALMRGSSEAEDGAQLAMIEILKSVHGYRGESSLERWCDRICARTVIRHARRVRARGENVVELRPELHARAGRRAGAGLAPAAVAAATAADELRVLFAELSDERVEVMVLKHGLGYSVREIADLTGAPEGTVKDRLVRARKDLRRCVDAQRSQRTQEGSR